MAHSLAQHDCSVMSVIIIVDFPYLETKHRQGGGDLNRKSTHCILDKSGILEISFHPILESVRARDLGKEFNWHGTFLSWPLILH